jgi:DNA end-binding protein Ku
MELHWLHKDCNRRIQYKKVCPVHGEVNQNEIVSGYQAGKNQYVIIENEDLKKLRNQRDDTIHVETFIQNDQLEPIYFSDTNYYLLPDGESAARPFVVFQRSMAEENRYGIAQIVLHRKQQLVAIRPVQELLVLTVLNYQQEIRQPESLQHDLPEVKASAKEVELARHLIDASTSEDFDFAQYRDTYTDKLRELVEAKRAGEVYAGEEEVESSPVSLDFAEALKKSLAQAARPKPRKRMVKAPAARPRHRKVS